MRRDCFRATGVRLHLSINRGIESSYCISPLVTLDSMQRPLPGRVRGCANCNKWCVRVSRDFHALQPRPTRIIERKKCPRSTWRANMTYQIQSLLSCSRCWLLITRATVILLFDSIEEFNLLYHCSVRIPWNSIVRKEQRSIRLVVVT